MTYLRITAAAIVSLAAGLALGTWLHLAPVRCNGPRALPGTTISVDSSGNASAPYNGIGTGLVCDSHGGWQLIP